MSRRWRKDSIFGDGPRLRLDREQRAQFRAKLHFNCRPGRLTIATAQLGRVLVDMLGADGRLDPSLETLAIRAGVAIARQGFSRRPMSKIAHLVVLMLETALSTISSAGSIRRVQGLTG